MEATDHYAVAVFTTCVGVHDFLINEHAQGRINVRMHEDAKDVFGGKTTLASSLDGVSTNSFANAFHLHNSRFV